MARDEQRIAALRSATPEAREGLLVAADACAAAHEAWQAARSELAELATVAAAADAASTVATERGAALAALEVPADLEHLAQEAEEARRAAVAAEAEEVRLGEILEAAEAAVPTAEVRDGLRQTRDRHRQLEQQLDRSASAAAAAAAARARAVQSASTAAEAAARADAARTASAAHVVREHLVVGEPCPVCEQMVAEVPQSDPPVEFRESRQAAEAAREVATHDEAAAARADGEASQLDAQVTELRSQLADEPDATAVEEELQRVAAAVTVFEDARGGLRAGREAARRADEARAATQRSLEQVRVRYREVREGLVGLGLMPPAESDDAAGDWSGLVGWAGAVHGEHADAAVAATDRATVAREAHEKRMAEIVAASERLDLGPTSADLDALISAVATRDGRLREQIARMDADLVERETLIASAASITAARDVARELARLLDAAHFERWLVSEAFDRLVAGGSERLDVLSDGRYAFELAAAGVICSWSTTPKAVNVVRFAPSRGARRSRRRSRWRWPCRTSSPTWPPTAPPNSNPSFWTKGSGPWTPTRSRRSRQRSKDSARVSGWWES